MIPLHHNIGRIGPVRRNRRIAQLVFLLAKQTLLIRPADLRRGMRLLFRFIGPNIEEYLYIYLNFRKFMYNGIKVAFSDTPEIEGYQYNT